MGAFVDLAGLDWTTILLLYVVLLVSLVFHEAAHALLALLGGDRTAYVGGQVTLNPIPHIQREPFGTVVLPLAVLVMSDARMCMGYAHAPYDPAWAARYPKRAALMAAAGPLSNCLLALLAFAVLKGLVLSGVAVHESRGFHPFQIIWALPEYDSGGMTAVIKIASTFLFLNILLAMINLVPLPPFDGAGVVEGLFPRQTGAFFEMVRGQLVFGIIAIVLVWKMLDYAFFDTMQWICNLL